MARPKKVIDFDKISQLASFGCTDEEIASVIGISRVTLTNGRNKKKYHEAKQEGINKSKVSLRQAMFKRAIKKDDPQMQKFLAKNMLDMSDKTRTEEQIDNERLENQRLQNEILRQEAERGQIISDELETMTLEELEGFLNE